ncbi:hypothetical protein PFISCL1PPCAC_14537, partial [Pristionchus fissidentatus]
IFQFSSLPDIPYHEEENVETLVQLMCANAEKIVVSMYSVEFLEFAQATKPDGCNIQRWVFIEFTQTDYSYRYFNADFYYFLFPKTIGRKLREQISFVSLSLFQPDQQSSFFLRRSLDIRSFSALSPSDSSSVSWSPLSFYSIGIILLICSSLLFVSLLILILEWAHHKIVVTR